ncbi:protein phosphatase 2A regulatory subunit cdc55 [Podila humilis]|nr:protein phosphatase 2A regulatory subunit cdc55 [Podila humilis]
MASESENSWKFAQCFGDKGEVEDITEADIISTVEFDHTGDYLATGDKGGRVVLFERNESKKGCEYKFHTEFQSHEPEFDYLKSLEIEEKINKIKWCKRQNSAHFLLSTNDKTVKLWKVFEKSIKVMAESNHGDGQHMTDVSGQLKMPKLTHHDTIVAAVPRKVYANAHAYHINSISINSDGETYISADDLRINLWNLNISDQSFNIVDIKPVNMEELTEVITAAEFHPVHCNLFMYSSSKGTIKLSDMRESALCDQHAKLFEGEEDPTNKSFFSEIISSISDVKFSKDGRYILSRDYLTLKVWDINMENRPVQTINIHDHLRNKLCDLYENDCIFDKFECTFSGDGNNVLTGSYNNNFHIYDRNGKNDVTLQADKSAFKAKRIGSAKNKTMPRSVKNGKKDDIDMETIDFTKKILHASWHPNENSIAVAATNNLFIFTSATSASRADSQPASVSKVTQIIFTALLLDILAFTIILPLFPRLLQYYRDSEHGNQDSLLAWSLLRLTEFQNWIGLDDSNNSSSSIKRPPKMDIVLLGGALGSLFSMLQFVASPVIGKLSDILGRRRVLLISMIGNLVSCGVWLFSNSFELFVLSRILGGLSEGNVQLSIAMISDITTPAARSRGLAMVGIAFAISFTIGPALGAYFANKDLVSSFPGLALYGLHPFSGSALLALVLLTVESLYLYAKLPETNSESWRLAVQSSVGEEKDTQKQEKTTENGRTSPITPISASTITPASAPFSRIAYDPATIVQLQHSYLRRLSFTHFAHLFLFSGMEFTLTFLTFHLFDFTHMQQGALLGYIGILSSLIQGGYVRRAAHKVGEKRMVLQGMMAAAVGLGCIALVSTGGEELLVVQSQEKGANASVGHLLRSTADWLNAQEWSRRSKMWGLYAGATGLAVTSATVVNCLTSLASLVCDMGSDESGKDEEEREQETKASGGTVRHDMSSKKIQPIGKGLALGRFRSWGQLGRAAGPIAACSLYWRVGPLVCYGTASLAVGCVTVLASRILPEVRKLPIRAAAIQQKKAQ